MQRMLALAGQVRNENIRMRMKSLAEKYSENFQKAADSSYGWRELERSSMEYPEKVEQIAARYVQMEKLDRDAENTESTRRLEKILDQLI